MEPSPNSPSSGAPDPAAGPDTPPSQTPGHAPDAPAGAGVSDASATSTSASGHAQASAPPPGAPPAPAPARRPAWTRNPIVLATALFVIVALVIAWAGTGYRYDAYASQPAELTGRVPEDERGMARLLAGLRGRERDLRARLRRTAPRGVYIVIDQTHNRIYLKKDEETILEGVCSAGSGMVLKETGGKNRQWVFDTPRGRFQVLSMTENPVWRKPDWAFVEEGQPIPKDPGERLEYGSLGEYALYFGDGYMIHGTLYERLLGRAVSHGCIRVGREDLRKVWANARLGTYIYIY